MNCKPGELAYFVRDDSGCGANLGLVVEIVAAAPPCDCLRCRNVGHCWEVVTTGRPIVSRVAVGWFEIVGETKRADVPDAWLRPIRPQAADGVDEMVERMGPAPKTLTEVREAQHG